MDFAHSPVANHLPRRPPVAAPSPLRSWRVSGASLRDTIADVRGDLSTMRLELAEARAENHRLRAQMERQSTRRSPLRSGELAALRRAVAFHCHPDRGGDDQVMRQLNALFDHLQQAAPADTAR